MNFEKISHHCTAECEELQLQHHITMHFAPHHGVMHRSSGPAAHFQVAKLTKLTGRAAIGPVVMATTTETENTEG